MATLTLNVDNALLPRLTAAYKVNNAAELKAALIRQIKNEVIAFEINQTVTLERAKVEAARTAAETKAAEAQAAAESEVVIS